MLVAIYYTQASVVTMNTKVNMQANATTMFILSVVICNVPTFQEHAGM